VVSTSDSLAVAAELASASGNPAQASVSLEAIRERCQEELSGTEFYQSVWNQQFQLGPSFRCIDKLWRRNGEVLGQLHLSSVSETEDAEERSEVAHAQDGVVSGRGKPAATASHSSQVRPEMLVLDASVQLLVAALPRNEAQQDVYVGTGQEFTRIYGSFPRMETEQTVTLWCQALLRPSNDYREEICGDLYIFDETSQIVAELMGVHLKRIGGETLQRLARTSTVTRQKGSLSREKLLTTEAGERLHMLETYLAEEVSRVLRLPISKLDVEESLASMVDSLMIMELKNQIEGDLETTVPVALIFEGDSISQLARLLLDHLTAEADELSQSLEQVDSETLAQMLAELEQLSDEEAEQVAEQFVEGVMEQVVEHEDEQVVQQETGQVVEHETRQVTQHEAGQLVEHETRQVTQHEAGPLVEHEAGQARRYGKAGTAGKERF
jgi:hypothetical protein